MSARMHDCPVCGPVIQEDGNSICCPRCDRTPADAARALEPPPVLGVGREEIARRLKLEINGQFINHRGAAHLLASNVDTGGLADAILSLLGRARQNPSPTNTVQVEKED